MLAIMGALETHGCLKVRSACSSWMVAGSKRKGSRNVVKDTGGYQEIMMASNEKHVNTRCFSFSSMLAGTVYMKFGTY